MEEYVFNHCTCTYVVDGDTLDVDISIGFDFYTKQRLRLYGVDTPERGDFMYEEAKNYVKEKCLNQKIQVITYHKDSFGRWISLIFVNGENLNDSLIINGYAIPYFD